MTTSVATIAAITAAMLTPGAVIHTSGRDAVWDGGGGSLIYDATSTAQADGGIVFAVAGAAGRLLRPDYTVFGYGREVHAGWFGVGRAAAASDAGLAAIKTSPHVGNAEVRLPSKVIIGKPFVNDRDGLKFRGNGSTRYLPEFGNPALLAASGTIIEASPAFPVGATLWTDTAKTSPGSLPRIGGGLSGATLNGGKRAGVAHAVLSVSGGDFDDVYALDATEIGLSLGVVKATDGTRIGSCSRNRFDGYGASGGRVGCALWGDVSVTSNACLSTFMASTMRGSEWGWELGNCDSNWFFGCGGGAAVLHAGDTCPRSLGEKTRSARANVFVAWQGGMVAKANIDPLSPPSFRNIVVGFTRENGADLDVEPGAKVAAWIDQTKRLGDCAGHMIGREPVGFLASLKALGMVIKPNTWTDAVWGLEHYEMPTGAHLSLVPQVVVPAGVVSASVSAMLIFADTAEKGRLSAQLLINGQPPAVPVFADAKATGCGPLTLASPTLKVVAGDVITVQVMQSTALNVTLEDRSWLAVEWG